MLFSFLNRERRALPPSKPFPADWRSILEQNVFLYRALPETEQARLRDLLQVFVAGKVWEGCAGLVRTDEIRVTIAAQACLLLLGFEDYCFDEVQSIRSEFFAVATECFFLQPVQLRRRHAGLYQVLAKWYRQDPAVRAHPNSLA